MPIGPGQPEYASLGGGPDREDREQMQVELNEEDMEMLRRGESVMVNYPGAQTLPLVELVSSDHKKMELVENVGGRNKLVVPLTGHEVSVRLQGNDLVHKRVPKPLSRSIGSIVITTDKS